MSYPFPTTQAVGGDHGNPGLTRSYKRASLPAELIDRADTRYAALHRVWVPSLA
jgi:hypothetical protein